MVRKKASPSLADVLSEAEIVADEIVAELVRNVFSRKAPVVRQRTKAARLSVSVTTPLGTALRVSALPDAWRTLHGEHDLDGMAAAFLAAKGSASRSATWRDGRFTVRATTAGWRRIKDEYERRPGLFAVLLHSASIQAMARLVVKRRGPSAKVDLYPLRLAAWWAYEAAKIVKENQPPPLAIAGFIKRFIKANPRLQRLLFPGRKEAIRTAEWTAEHDFIKGLSAEGFAFAVVMTGIGDRGAKFSNKTFARRHITPFRGQRARIRGHLLRVWPKIGETPLAELLVKNRSAVFGKLVPLLPK